jgi:hypothetical protein
MLASLMLLQQRGQGGIGVSLSEVLLLLLSILYLIGAWKVFTKAGKPGWGVLIPIYNLYLLCKIAGRSGWWVILMIIPLVNFVIYFILAQDIGRAFDKGGVWSFFWLFLLSYIGVLILGFGGARYLGPGGYGHAGQLDTSWRTT